MRSLVPTLARWTVLAGLAGAGMLSACEPVKNCVPMTCPMQGKNCGSVSDGCGGNLECGSCQAPMTCGGGGSDHVCGTPGSACNEPDGCFTEGARQCAGSGFEECRKKATGCLAWSDVTACESGTFCSGGVCREQCLNQCAEGAVQCAGTGTGVQTCKKMASGCTDWDAAAPCLDGKLCSGGRCVNQCVNQCTEGATQCADTGTGVQTCKKMSTGCTDRDSALACAANKICSGGQCVSACANQCAGGRRSARAPAPACRLARRC